MTADNPTSVNLPDGVEAWAGRCFCGGRLVRASRYGGHVVCAQLKLAEPCEHVWVDGNDGFRRGKVCVYCGEWKAHALPVGD